MKKITFKLKLFISLTVLLGVTFISQAQVCALTGSGGYNVAGVTTTGGTTNISLSSATVGTNNYASIAQTVTAEIGGTFNLSVTQGNTCSRVLIWIDFNGDDDYGDGTTGDTGEFFEIGNSNAANTMVLATNITVPTTAVAGTHKIRILSGDAWGFAVGSESYGFIVPGPCGFYANMAVKDFNIKITNPTNTYTGGTSDWATSGNWSLSRVPLATDNVTVPASQTVVVSSSTGAVCNNLTVNATGSLTIDNGGSLIVSGTSSGNITYNLDINDTNWHLVSSPVVGEQFDAAWVTANNIATGIGSNRGISWYDNGTADTDTDGAGSDTATGHWRYYAGGVATAFGSGVGYSMKRSSGTNYGFTGTYKTDNLEMTIDQDVNNWNLVGNPYPSYVKVSDVINDNAANLTDTHEFIYVWDNNKTGGAGYATLAGTDYIHPGQAFFVNAANSTANNFTITENRQSHQTGVTLYKNALPSIKLFVKNSDNKSEHTEISYQSNATKSLDRGLDAGTFTGVPSNFNIYTHLVSDSKGVDFMHQVLPLEYENQIIPVGVKANAGEIIFTASVSNLPSSIKVFLEDRKANTFTRLDESNSFYKSTFTEATEGIGQFYLHTTQNSLNVQTANLSNLKMYTIDRTLRILGLSGEKSNVKLFNILGKQVFNTSFITNDVSEISLPKLSSGIYIVQLENVSGKLNKKIILE